MSKSEYFSVPDSGPFEIYKDSNEFRWYIDLCCELRKYKIHADYLVFQNFDELQAYELYLCIRDKKDFRGHKIELLDVAGGIC